MISISVVIPTVARPTLVRTSASIVHQLGPKDKVHLICDGDEAFEKCAWVENLEGYVRVNVPSVECWIGYGQQQRNWALDNVPLGDYIVWSQDDDALKPSALNSVRIASAEFPGRPLMFRMMHHRLQQMLPALHDENGKPRLRVGNVSEQMFVTPNIPERLGRFGNRYEGDWDFISETVKLHGGEEALVWRPEVICEVFPP